MNKQSFSLFLSLICVWTAQNAPAMARINNLFSSAYKNQPASSISSFKNIKKEQSVNLYKRASRWDHNEFKRYAHLNKELNHCNQDIKESKKLIATWHGIALGIAPAAFSGMAMDIAPGLMLGIAAGPGLIGICSSAVTVPSSLNNMWQQYKNRSKIETEIRQIVTEQMREARMREDIQ